MWLELLNRMSLIDDLDVATVSGTTTVTLTPIKLAQFREGVPRDGEAYTVQWSRNGVVQANLNNLFTFSGTQASLAGSWTVTLEFTTPEIRVDNLGSTVSTEAFTI